MFLFILLATAESLREINNYLDVPFDSTNVGVVYLGESKGYGLILKKDVKKGEILASIPYNYTFSSLSYFPLYPYISDMEFHTIIAVRFIWEKNQPGTFFHKFTQSFNSDYNLVIFWDDDLKKTITEYSIFYEDYDFYGKNWEKEYEEVKNRLKNIPEAPKDIYNLTLWKWAYSCAVAKTFDIWGNEWKTALGLEVEESDYKKFIPLNVPIIDLANHRHVPKRDRIDYVYYLKYGNGCFSLMAQQDFIKGEEASLEYEYRGNDHMLAVFGFALEKNYLENFKITKQSDFCNEIKQGENCNCTWVLKMYEMNDNFFVFINRDGDVKKTLISYRKKDIYDSAKYPLRHVRRIKLDYGWRYIMALNYGIGQRILLLEHMRFAEQKILKNFISELKLDTLSL
ncbi:hypothetical protein SteCoe_2650 [Stentor coeruleus]|uniref:SET domain-containing protein n=1 Tax=Stentor coeruleus TaxID=5963 RepID=A0A1R2CYT7_9CILI|nr:hypothetical protein SteCoe_2650 [Stentor coeruleus]